MHKIWFFLLMTCLSIPAFAHSRKSYSVGIICHLVPARKCWVEATVTEKFNRIKFKISDMFIALATHNISIQSGIYDGLIQIRKGDIIIVKKLIKIRVLNNRIFLYQQSMIARRLRKVKLTGYYVLRWESYPILTPKALPLAVSDVTEGHGSIKAFLIYNGQRVASSSESMRPAKGCWIHEQTCQPH